MNDLEIRGLCKSYGGLKVLQDISLTVAAGERRAIIGPNGAGKTTLFDAISGLARPSSGSIRLFGRDVTRLSAYRRSRLGLARTFQRNNLFFTLTLLENVNLAHLASRSATGPERLLREWGLWPKRQERVGELSYGEQRQVELLMALVQSPRLILLDEPTAGMSPLETRQMAKVIAGLDRGLTIVIIEHDMDVVFNLADRISVLHQGRVLCEGPPATVRANPQVRRVYLGTDK